MLWTNKTKRTFKEFGLPAVLRTDNGILWLPSISYVLRRLSLRTFSDSLQSCRPSFGCSTRSDSWSNHVPRS
jgi:hypothetical protein